jgi:hypothetical protein
MTSSTLHRPGTDHDELLPVFAIRAELEVNADQATLNRFGAEVEHAIRVAADEGSVEPVNGVLRTWLRIALTAQDESYFALSRDDRGRRGEQLIERWVQVNSGRAA